MRVFAGREDDCCFITEGKRYVEIQTQCAHGRCSGWRIFATNAYAETTLNALFMAQAAYSEADVRAMTDAFAKANPDVKVNLEFVPYEGLHDKTVLAQGSGGGYDVVLFDVIWPAEYASNKVLVDVSSRVTDDMKKNVLPGAWTTVQYDRRLLRHAVDPRYEIPVLQQGHP